MKGLIFTYLLAYGGAFVSLFRPWYGLLIYVCFAIIRPESLWHWSFEGGGRNFSRIIAIALLVGWAVNGLGRWDFGRSRSTVFALVGLWFWAALSGLLAANDTAAALYYLESVGKIVLPFVVGITLIDSQEKLKQLAWVILISQGYVAWELNLSYLRGFNILGPAGPGYFGGLDNNCVAIAMVTGAGLAFFLGLHERTWWRKWLAFAAAGLMAHTIMFAFSRGGMVGLLLTGFVTFLLIDKRPRHFAFFGLAVVAGLLLAGPEVRARFASAFVDKEKRDASAESRIEMWGQCLQLMAERPVLGVGPDQWTTFAKYRFGWGKRKEAHSLWLQTGAELGFVGLGLLLLFYLGTVARLWPVARRKVPNATEWDVAVARMTIASLTGFMVSAQFVSLEGLEIPYYITLIGAGSLKLRPLPHAAMLSTIAFRPLRTDDRQRVRPGMADRR
jgi:probable O-glycosylation ligase (exosortase A-associated)